MSDILGARQPVGCKSVFEVTSNADASVARYRSRIIAAGYCEIEALVYDETFAAVMRYYCLRLLIALGIDLDLDTDQLDIQSAFLNRDLVQEIWIVPLPGIGLDGMILRLDKALYVLKQAPLT